MTEGGTFNYRVKAYYVNGTQSAWSNIETVTLVDNGPVYDLGDVILRSVLRSMVLENIVEKYKNDFMKAVTEYALTDKTENDATALAAQLGNITSSLREELEDSGGIFNAIIEAFRDAGLVDYNMDNEVSNTVGGGIKSITEDTAIRIDFDTLQRLYGFTHKM